MDKTKRALITGITGQDGSYLKELLLTKGYEIYGLIRRSSSAQTIQMDSQGPSASTARLIYGDLNDTGSVIQALAEIRPDEIYNLGAQSHVRVSFDIPEYTANTIALGTIRLLEGIRRLKLKNTRFYQASSSELFGKATESPQKETTPFHPCSPYACAKAHAYWATVNYREFHNLFTANGILFNHESPRRDPNFVSRKITMGAARIKLGLQKKLHLGNLEAQRDWGYAKEYVEAMWLMLQQEQPDDFVIATGELHSVKEFTQEAFAHLGLDWQRHVEVDQRYYWPSVVERLKGDTSKARSKLGWQARTSFRELIHLMVDADLGLAKKEAAAANL